MEKDLLLEKWLNSSLTEAEAKAFRQESDYELNEAIIDTARHFKASHFSQIDDYDTFKAKRQSAKVEVKKLNWLTPVLRVASVIVIAFGIYFSFFFNPSTSVTTLVGEKLAVELPDHSQVVLNALSSIEYDKKDWDENRALRLEGEAYFKVAKGELFDVITSQGLISVVGTQFNVKQRQDYFEVKCFEGIVKVTSDTITRTLLAGNTYRLFEGQFTEEKITQTAPQWIKNSSIFNAIPVTEVISELERQYKVKVILKEVNTDRLFTGGFTHDNLNNALISITQPMNMTYELNSLNQVILHGQEK